MTLTTFAPTVTDTDPLWPTGNLAVALPEIDADGTVHSLNILSEARAGMVTAIGPVLRPSIFVDGARRPVPWKWSRQGNWIPCAHGELALTDQAGSLSAHLTYLVPVAEHGVVARLSVANTSPSPIEVNLEFTGAWTEATVHHFRAKPLDTVLRTRDEPWTGTRSVSAGTDLAIAWRPGPEATLSAHDGDGTWQATRHAHLAPGGELVLEVYLGVAPEPDGAAGTALHLRRRAFAALHRETLEWLTSHGLRTGRDDLDERLNLNLFFNYFYAQANCLDTGRPVMMTSRSPRYYVCAAFWSRDAFYWTFPALVLTDPGRSREVLLASLSAAGDRVAHHALYITGTRMYPGFELDELAIPALAIWRYVDATGDRSVLDEPAVLAYRDHLTRELAQWQRADGLVATFLLPTDDPTEYPYTATDNALVAVALDALTRLDPHWSPGIDVARLRELVAATFAIGSHDGPGWAWAVDADGRPEFREEPPLSLRTLPYWGIRHPEAQRKTEDWLVGEYPFHYSGPYPGAGAPHFTSPSAFDLANRMLTANNDLGDPLEQFLGSPLDNGVGCESWDPETGVVSTGAAMASVAGFLAWTAWAHVTGHQRWDQPLHRTLTPKGQL